MLVAPDMMNCQNLAVPAEVMAHVVGVESSGNPYAIGVVGGRLERQPRNLPEAVATARMLEERGYDYSLGIAQVNRSNLRRFGLHTHEEAFDYCANLTAGSRILAECYARAGNDWGKAFSCYYSGNFATGFRHGYVQRVLQSMRGPVTPDAEAIPLVPDAAATAATAGLPAEPASPLAQAPRGSNRPDVFVPKVRGPGDSIPGAPAAAATVPSRRTADEADVRQAHADEALVF